MLNNVIKNQPYNKNRLGKKINYTYLITSSEISTSKLLAITRRTLQRRDEILQK